MRGFHRNGLVPPVLTLGTPIATILTTPLINITQTIQINYLIIIIVVVAVVANNIANIIVGDGVIIIACFRIDGQDYT